MAVLGKLASPLADDDYSTNPLSSCQIESGESARHLYRYRCIPGPLLGRAGNDDSNAVECCFVVSHTFSNIINIIL